ncbi:oligoendopeptidase F [Candidatus Phytoplasma luffae]|uniref:Oligoendopeptidase F n=1 Tax=Loofah witches'-broom phytoplasma TaxID=35773 RepID=A0A975FI72_LOWBP|nr:M3 family oligoendopeptidase [Candidatus Phytoplasma luffae]QTX02838.1 oligoendopeptidase F [Candidatus Phytoplasma luffae]
MKFQDFIYERVDLQKVKSKILPMIEEFCSVDVKKQVEIINDFHKLNDKIETMFTLVNIRYTLDTKDIFYQNEKLFCDQNGPLLTELKYKFYQQILKSKYYDFLKNKFGNFFWKKAKLFVKTFNPKIISLVQKENSLVTEYQKLIAEPTIDFQNKKYNLSQMAPFFESLSRQTRKEAQKAVSNFFQKKEDEYDRLYDELVKTRTEMAHNLGYENFVQLGYDILERTDYSHKEIAVYRENILEIVLPFFKEMQKRKSEFLGIKKLESYDKGFYFSSGNPKPQGDAAAKIKIAKKMYQEISPETKDFFEFMLEKNLLDVESKPNKVGGGYCTYLPIFKSPFIFANFNGTKHDIDVLTHEAGHAFQIFQSRNLIPDYRWPTMDAAEIHSMTMEFLTWPWMKDFFGSDVEKYKFIHLSGAVNFLLYGALVDHFQHEIYSNPQFNPEKRKQIWRELEKKYLLLEKYEEDDFLEKGNFWLRQMHIFTSPFYYIDYTLAQICALDFWNRSQKNYKKNWELYLNLCKKGGSENFLQLLKNIGLKSPFDKNHLKTIVDECQKYLQMIPNNIL